MGVLISGIQDKPPNLSPTPGYTHTGCGRFGSTPFMINSFSRQVQIQEFFSSLRYLFQIFSSAQDPFNFDVNPDPSNKAELLKKKFILFFVYFLFNFSISISIKPNILFLFGFILWEKIYVGIVSIFLSRQVCQVNLIDRVWRMMINQEEDRSLFQRTVLFRPSRITRLPYQMLGVMLHRLSHNLLY